MSHNAKLSPAPSQTGRRQAHREASSSPARPEDKASIWLAVALAATIPFLYFVLLGNVGLSLWDEGYLWYGVQRVLRGEIPLRDFQSYDVGRYYLAAAIMAALSDNGIVALRASNSVLQALAVGLGTYLLAQRSRGLMFPLLAAASMFCWMYPDFKAAGFVATMALVLAFVIVIEKPLPGRFFACGAIIGLVAILGRNHGVYGLVASILMFVYVSLRQRRGALASSDGPATRTVIGTSFVAWAAGVVAGYAPMLIMIAITPDYPRAFFNSVLFLFEHGATNIALPLQMPWSVQIRYHGMIPLATTLQELTIAVLLLAMPAFGVVAYAWALSRRLGGRDLDPLFVASTLLIVPYSHYALSRASLWNLAFGILPFLVAVLALASRRRFARNVVAAIVLAVSVLVIVPIRPAIRDVRDGGWPTVQVLGDRLRIDRDTAAEIRLLETLIDRYAPGDTPFLAVPYWPGAYAVFNRRSPMFDIYPITARNELVQREEIERIERADPGFVIVSDIPLDGRDDLRFRNTNPLIERFIRERYIPVTDIDAPPYLRVYRRPG